MNDLITEEFLKGNLFEQDKIGAGYFPWRYYEKAAGIPTPLGVG